MALRSKPLSTFFRPAHTWRQYANSFGQKTLKWAPSSGGKLPNYSGLPSSHRPEDLAWSSHRTQKKKKKNMLPAKPQLRCSPQKIRNLLHWRLISSLILLKEITLLFLSHMISPPSQGGFTAESWSHKSRHVHSTKKPVYPCSISNVGLFVHCLAPQQHAKFIPKYIPWTDLLKILLHSATLR